MIYVKPLKEEDFLDSHGKFNETRQLKSREAEVGKNNVKLEKIKYLQSYIFVAGFGQVRAVCLDGFSDHCIFVSLYYYY